MALDETDLNVNAAAKRMVDSELYYQWEAMAQATTEIMNNLDDTPESNTARIAIALRDSLVGSSGGGGASIEGDVAEGDIITVSKDGMLKSAGISVTDVQEQIDQIKNVRYELNNIEDPVGFSPSDTGEYNSEWVERMTGLGTAASPYCIYTPYDFNMLRSGVKPVTAGTHYKLMNNLDFAPVIGMSADDVGNLTVTDSDAPLYNGGYGFAPLCYKDDWSSYSDSSIRIDFDGNDKTIKGIIQSAKQNYRYLGIFGYCGYDFNLHNLTIADSSIIAPANLSSPYIASVGYNEGRNSLINLISYARLVIKCAIAYAGGFSSSVSTNSIYKNCSFHGTLKADMINLYAAGIAQGTANNVQYINCINTADISGTYVTGIANNSSQSNNTARFINCVSYGRVYWNGYGSATSRYELGIGYATPAGKTADCYQNCYYNALSGNFAPYNEADQNDYFTATTTDRMKEAGFVSVLNSNSDEPGYAFNDIGILEGAPLTLYEYNMSRAVDANLSLSLINSETKTVQSSQFPFRRLYGLARLEDVKALFEMYSRMAGNGGVPCRMTAAEYGLEDICFDPSMRSYKYLECVSEGTSGDGSLSDSYDVGDLITDGTVTWLVCDRRDSNPVGSFKLDYVVRKGYVAAYGQTLKKAEYPRLWKWVSDSGLWLSSRPNEGQGGGLFLSASEGDEDFTLPDFADKYVRCEPEMGHSGWLNADGLPNITADVDLDLPDYAFVRVYNRSGAFAVTTRTAELKVPDAKQISKGSGVHGLAFSAKNSNSIYGHSEKVTPRNISLYPLIKY